MHVCACVRARARAHSLLFSYIFIYTYIERRREREREREREPCASCVTHCVTCSREENRENDKKCVTVRTMECKAEFVQLLHLERATM